MLEEGEGGISSRGQFADEWARKFQYLLDKSSPHILYRWIGFAVCLLLYFIRVFTLEAFFVVTYALGIFLLNQLIEFISPQFDPESEEGGELSGGLPTKAGEEYRPFARRLPEFRFWYSCTRAVVISFFLTFFGIVDIPVYWPILLLYFFVLFFITMKRQLEHMWKYKYIPISWGKPKPGQKSNK